MSEPVSDQEIDRALGCVVKSYRSHLLPWVHYRATDSLADLVCDGRLGAPRPKGRQTHSAIVGGSFGGGPWNI